MLRAFMIRIIHICVIGPEGLRLALITGLLELEASAITERQ